jgi:hypothetical protein
MCGWPGLRYGASIRGARARRPGSVWLIDTRWRPGRRGISVCSLPSVGARAGIRGAQKRDPGVSRLPGGCYACLAGQAFQLPLRKLSKFLTTVWNSQWHTGGWRSSLAINCSRVLIGVPRCLRGFELLGIMFSLSLFIAGSLATPG